MKTNVILHSLTLGTLLTISASAFAHDDEKHYRRDHNDCPAFCNYPEFKENLRLRVLINERQDKQTDQILEGLYERRITPIEFRKLMDEQREIMKMERTFLSDGFLSKIEFQKLDAALDEASRRIFKESHDAEGRSGFRR